MKKLLGLLIGTAMVFSACHNKNNESQTEEPAVVVEQPNSNNPYISENEAAEADVIEEDLSGKLITLSADDFVKRITEIDNPKGFSYKGTTPCIVDFYADWCTPCIKFKPTLEALAQKYKGRLIIYKINVDKAQDVCKAFDISNIPTLMFFNRNEAPRKMVGSVSSSEMDKIILDFLNE